MQTLLAQFAPTSMPSGDYHAWGPVEWVSFACLAAFAIAATFFSIKAKYAATSAGQLALKNANRLQTAEEQIVNTATGADGVREEHVIQAIQRSRNLNSPTQADAKKFAKPQYVAPMPEYRSGTGGSSSPPNSKYHPTILLAMILCAAPIVGGFGCVSRAELTTQREAIAHGTEGIRKDRHDWSHAIAGDPAYKLPDLSAFDANQKAAWLKEKDRVNDEFNTWLEDGRARDANRGFFSFFTDLFHSDPKPLTPTPEPVTR